MNTATTESPFLIVFWSLEMVIALNFAAKVRNLREKTSGMAAKKLCVSSNWLIYSDKKFNV